MKTGASIHFSFLSSQKLLDFDYGDEEEEEEEEPVEETSTLAPPETNLEDSGGRPSEPNALALRSDFRPLARNCFTLCWASRVVQGPDGQPLATTAGYLTASASVVNSLAPAVSSGLSQLFQTDFAGASGAPLLPESLSQLNVSPGWRPHRLGLFILEPL
ncbi:hypothetical protein IscW_ISCW001745 [Ixodes scapularis]|uniref:Uncharacterized protein n=1 Tax=Ixodes scapularis TaxID=6945 RepID=B7P1E4_IXOSC|nr:hypothetical protein IscW_ISCW001745 [Ixodes scapularis]|eukprot:XP_002433352.1 hypothetical protein IscW_ISCW001745 [Ixodes scapularis]